MSLRTESFLVGLIGDGITSSLTPPCMRRRADAREWRYLYRPVGLDALNLDGASAPALLDAAALLGFNAFNITHPCKQSVMEHLHELSDAARALGAVNCVVIPRGRYVLRDKYFHLIRFIVAEARPTQVVGDRAWRRGAAGCRRCR